MERDINVHEYRQCQQIARGTIFATRVARNGSTISQRKSGRDEARGRRISCSMRKHVAEVKHGLINHIHRYNVYIWYARPSVIYTRTYVHTRVSRCRYTAEVPVEVVQESGARSAVVIVQDNCTIFLFRERILHYESSLHYLQINRVILLKELARTLKSSFN